MTLFFRFFHHHNFLSQWMPQTEGLSAQKLVQSLKILCAIRSICKEFLINQSIFTSGIIFPTILNHDYIVITPSYRFACTGHARVSFTVSTCLQACAMIRCITIMGDRTQVPNVIMNFKYGKYWFGQLWYLRMYKSMYVVFLNYQKSV